jgi:hypothetical protein
MAKQSEVVNNIINGALLTLAVKECIKGTIKSLIDMPQTTFAGLLYGLMYNEDIASNSQLDNQIIRLNERYKLVNNIRRSIQSIENFNSPEQPTLEYLQTNITLGNYKTLIDSLGGCLRNNDSVADCQKIHEQIEALKSLQELPYSFRVILQKLFSENSNQREQQAALLKNTQVLDLTDKAKNLKLALQLRELLHSKKSIYIDDFDLMMQLMTDHKHSIKYSYKTFNKKVFAFFNKMGSAIRSLLILRNLLDNQTFQKFLGVVGLCIVLPIYATFISIKISQFITIGVLDILKMLLLGGIMGLSDKKQEIATFLIDFKKLSVEAEYTYKCLLASENKNVDSDTFHSKSGKQSIIKTLEKIIYQLLIKVFESTNQDVEQLRELMKAYNNQKSDPENIRELKNIMQQLYDKFEDKKDFPIKHFTLYKILQHKNAFFDFLEVFPKRAAFTAGYNFVDYCKGMSENNLDLNAAQHV